MGLTQGRRARTRRAMVVALAALTGISLCASPEAVGAAPSAPTLPAAEQFVAVATESVRLGTNTNVVSGSVGVNTSGPSVEVQLGNKTRFAENASLWADSVQFDSGVRLQHVVANTVRNPPAATSVWRPFNGPVVTFPTVAPANPGTNAVFVFGQRTLEPGRYGNVVVRPNSTLRLTGGQYHFRALSIGSGSTLEAQQAAQVRIADRLDVARDGRLQPVAPLNARSLVVTVDGKQGATFGPESTARATVVAAGPVTFGSRAQGIGTFRASRISTGIDGILRLDGEGGDPPTGGAPKLSVDKTGPASVVTGAQLTYTLTVTNTGDAPAQSVTLTDILPSTGTFVSSTPALTPSNGRVTLAVGALAAKATRQLTVVWRAPNAAGSLLNKATAAGSGLAAVNDEVTTTVRTGEPTPQKKLTVDVQAPGQVQVHEDFAIDVVVTNGTDALVRNGSVVITLPAGHFLGADPKATPSNGKLTIALGDLAAGAVKRVKVQWRPMATGTLTTPATVSGTGATSATDSATTQVVAKPTDNLEFQHLAGIRLTTDELDQRMKSGWSCNKGSGTVTAGPFADALAAARTFARGQADEATYNAMKADLKDPRDASRIAGMSLLVGRPTAGLAVLLEAYDREPNNPDHLLNTAAFLLKLKQAGPALGFLAEAERVGGLTTVPLGISARATLLTTRASVLLNLGDPASAEAAARQATQLSPKSSEAQLALAFALHCLDRQTEGVAPYRTAINPEARPTFSAEELNGIESLSFFDIPSGQPTMRLPSVVDFKNIDQANAVHTRVYDEMFPEHRRRIEQRSQRRNQLRNEAIAAGWFTPVTERMLRDTELRIRAIARRVAPLKDEWDAVEAAEAELDRVVDYHTDCGDGAPWCRTWKTQAQCREMMTAYHKDWRQLEQAHTRAIDAYLQAAYPHFQGMATNFSDPISRELVQIFITDEVESLYYTFAHGVIGSQANFLKIWTSGGCVPTSGTIEASPPSTALDGPKTSTLCGDNVKKIQFVAEFRGVEVGLDCEKISLETELTSYRWMSAFAKAELGSAGIAFYLGTKIATPDEAKIGIFGGEAAFESGLYIKFDRDLKFRDVGWRIGPSASSSAGPVQVEVFDDTMELSFVGALDYLVGD